MLANIYHSEYVSSGKGNKANKYDEWIKNMLYICIYRGFPGGSGGKKSACSVRELGSITGLGRSPGGGHGNPFQYSCLENPHVQRSLVGYSPWVTKSQTQLND